MAEEAMNQSRRIKAELSRKVILANSDLVQRMETEGIEIEYSPEDDYLRVTIGQPKSSIGISWPDDIYSVALVDPDSHQINALEAPFFMEALVDHEPENDLWSMVVRLIKSGRTNVYIPPKDERERTERAIQQLVGSNAKPPSST